MGVNRWVHNLVITAPPNVSVLIPADELRLIRVQHHLGPGTQTVHVSLARWSRDTNRPRVTQIIAVRVSEWATTDPRRGHRAPALVLALIPPRPQVPDLHLAAGSSRRPSVSPVTRFTCFTQYSPVSPVTWGTYIRSTSTVAQPRGRCTMHTRSIRRWRRRRRRWREFRAL